MSKLGFIKRHYKGFLLFSGCCLVLLSLGFNMVILPWYDKQQMKAKEKELPPLETPLYGVMPAAVTDTYKWKGTTTGVTAGINGACRINNSNYFVTVAHESSNADGWANVLYVWGNNGTIKKSVISSYEYDADNGEYATIKHIPGTNKYVIAYRDTATVAVCTIQIWDNNGTIKQSVIDYQALTYRCYSASDGVIFLLQVTGNVWAIAYNEITTNDGWIETVWINSSGTINNSLLDSEEFDAAFGNQPRLCLVDSNTIAVSYTSASDYVLMTYNISSAGLITDTPADSWIYEASQYDHSYINKVGPTIYAISYIDGSKDGYAKTLAIANTGMITKSWIDTLTVFTDTAARYLETFVVHDPQTTADGNGILGMTFQDSSTDGKMYTWNVTSAGVMPAAVVDSLEFNATDEYYFAHVEWVNKSYYLIIYTNIIGGPGWSNTVQIDTNYASPTFANPSPANNSVDQALTPQCAITVNDLNGDAMTVNFYENSTGSYVLRQTNSSCANGTYRWTYSQASANSQKYYWKASVSDSAYNVSAWYSFTTLASAPTNNLTISNPYPANASTGIATGVRCNITISQSAGKKMSLEWYENSTGSYVLRQTNGTTNWYNQAWLYRKLITVDHTKITTSLTNFPILVYFATDTGLATYAQTNGNDICFVKYSDNRTKLNHEIENFTKATGKLSAWVNSSYLSSSVDTKIWMYYGNTVASNQQSKYNVWAPNYGGVWHMNTINATDSTSNKNNGTQTGVPGTAAGIVNTSVDFKGTPPATNPDLINVGTGSSIDLSDCNTFTYECWINFDSSAADQVFMGQQKTGNSWGTVLGTYDTEVATNAIKFITRDDDGTARDTLTSGVAITTGSWMYVAGTYINGVDNKSIYINGLLKASTTAGINNLRAGPITQTQIGYLGDYGACDGRIDEVRMSKIAFNSSWINATYRTISSPSTFISLGDAQSLIPNGTYSWTYSQASANSQKYYWKVYINDGTHNVSNWYCFTTLAAAAFPDSPSPFTASKRDSSSLALAWTKGAGADYTRIQYKTGGYPTTIADGTNACNNTGSSYLLPGLAAGTKYYFSGWSWNTTNKAWSVNPTNVNQTTKAYASLYTSTLTGGNITTIYRSLFTSLLTGGNITTTYRALFTSTLTGGNATSIYKALFTSTLTGGNISTTKSLFTSLLTGGNISSDKSLFTSLLTGGNVTTIYKSLFTSILTGGNISIGINPLFTSLLTGGNTTAYASLFTSTLTGGNISSDKSLFTSLLTGGNITNRYVSLFTSLLTGGNISLTNWVSLFTSTLTGGNISSNHSLFTSLLSGGNITSPHSSWTSLLTGGNTSVLTPITPFNPNLYLINPNPGNGTHNTNYLKSNASGLTTSIDVFYENFTTPAALMPGDYSMTIIGTTPANTPVIWNTSAVYATVHDTLYGIITPGNPYVGQYYLNPNYDIFRSFLLFNTGLIPNEAIINSAYIQLVVYDDYSDDDFNVTVQETKLPVPHNPLITLDYYKNSFSNYFGHTNTTGYTDEDIFNIALTPLGVAFLEKSDETAFGIRSDQDINSSAPTGDEFVIFYGYGVATAKYPKLIVNFTIPPSNWAYFVNLTWLSNSSGAWTEYYKSYINSNGTTTVPAINFSGVDTYFWHLEWESNHTNNGSSQVFTFTTVNASGGSGHGIIIMNTKDRFLLGLEIGGLLFFILGMIIYKKRKNYNKTK